jgi:hypothetical protein
MWHVRARQFLSTAKTGRETMNFDYAFPTKNNGFGWVSAFNVGVVAACH